MKALKWLFMMVIYLLVCEMLLAQEIAVYNDKSSAWIDPAQMVASIERMFPKKNILYKVVKAPELES